MSGLQFWKSCFKEEGRRKKEEGRRKKEEGRGRMFLISDSPSRPIQLEQQEPHTITIKG
jgi:hypothetical protein